MHLYFDLAITVMFGQSMYSANEDTGSIQVELVLSGESSTDITVRVFSTDGSATGEYYSVSINYQYHNGMTYVLQEV